MNILAIGLNHKTAPIDIRECLAFDSAETANALMQLKAAFPENEFVLLSTCNRVEFYIATNDSYEKVTEDIVEFLSQFHDIAPDDFRDFLYIYEGQDAVRHLFVVASSLDSMMVGEMQIIAQVKDSFRLACSAKSTGKVLNRLFHRSFATSKKILTDTSISTGRVSIAGVAVDLAGKVSGNISSAKVVVIGAGEVAELLVKHLLHVDCKDITVINRSLQRGRDLASRYNIAVRRWGQLSVELAAADIVISSAAVKGCLFTQTPFKKIMAKRKKPAVLIIDLGVPRNFEPSVNSIDGVYLYNIDELSELAKQNRQARHEDITKAMYIITEKVGEFTDWLKATDIGPLIGQMKGKFNRIARNEIEQFFAEKKTDASNREIVESMVHRMVNKLLHCVIENINIVTREKGPAEAAKLVDDIVRNADEVLVTSDDKYK